MRYQIIRCSDGYDTFFPTRRKAVLAMKRLLNSTWFNVFALIDTETHEKWAYIVEDGHASVLRDVELINYVFNNNYVARAIRVRAIILNNNNNNNNGD